MRATKGKSKQAVAEDGGSRCAFDGAFFAKDRGVVLIVTSEEFDGGVHPPRSAYQYDVVAVPGAASAAAESPIPTRP